MDKTATNTAPNTEEDVLPSTDSSILDSSHPTIVDNPEVGKLDTNLQQNTSDNTGGTNINTANSYEANLEFIAAEAAESTSIISNTEPSERPKRSAKPSEKHIKNRLQSDEAKLDKLWRNTTNALAKLHETPDSADQIKSHTSEVRSLLHQYRTVSLSLLEFLGDLSDPQYQKEYETLQRLTNNRSQYIQTVIDEANERKREIMLETSSSRRSRSSRNSRSSATSSTAARALAKAEATAALKKVEMQKWRSLRETRSALEIQQQELTLAQRKLEEKARMETLRLEEEAVVAVTKFQAIDRELSFVENQEPEPLNLPRDDPVERVQRYVISQHFQEPPPTLSNPAIDPQSHQVNPQVQGTPPKEELNPTANMFTPQPQNCRTGPNPNPMSAYINFMARRELIANKTQKFDDNPRNFHGWKESFKNMIRDINITPNEELSLIIEHTCNESKKLAQRLRNAYINKPTEGVAIVWQKLGQRFGSNAVITEVHLNKLRDFPEIGFRDNKQLQELGDLLLELQCAKADGGYKGLKILDEPVYIKPVIAKLPGDIQSRWQRHAFRYKKQHAGVDYPPFSEFATFIQELSLERNDPNLTMAVPENRNTGIRHPSQRQEISTKKTGIHAEDNGAGHDPPARDPTNWCIVHRTGHPLNECRAFQAKSLDERSNILRQNRVCFRCIASCDHLAKDCKAKVVCVECGSDKHLVALHAHAERMDGGEQVANKGQHGDGARTPQNQQTEAVTTKCTELCGSFPGGKSCSKICLANIYVSGHPETKVKSYVVIDDQSNSSLAKSELFDHLNIHGQTTTYSLKTCSGVSQIRGRCSKDLVVESLDGSKRHQLSNAVECNTIPDSKEEIPTPQVAQAYPHLRGIADEIPEICDDTEILLLVGRDAPPLQKTHESRNGPRNAPWAQRLDLGWVIIGNACLDGAHKPSPSCYHTNILESGRPSILLPCPNRFHIKEKTLDGKVNDQRKEISVNGSFDDGLGANVFAISKDDNKPGLSVEDRTFASLMDREMVKNDAGNWEAPLPFRNPMTALPDNREDTRKRFNSTKRTLERKPEMKKHYFQFMQKLFENGHAEPVPESDGAPRGARWYLPHFGVYHPRKPGKIRVVFDSAAETNGVSLNKVLISGPDLTNSLLGVLLRFRRGPIALMTDIEQMFHAFHVREDHRDFLRFFWYKDNNPEEEVIEYRMKVHLFGNTSSPAIATCGLRKTALDGEQEYGSDAREFVEKDFYVDDGLKSMSNSEGAIDLLLRTKAMLAAANLRLHKIASNNSEVTRAFAVEDQASDLRNLDLHRDIIPIQRSLGVFWDLRTDAFTFQVTDEVKPFTRRGVLSVTNSLYDPLGIAAPVVIKAKMLLRAMTANFKRHPLDEWDEPLPEQHRSTWEAWCKSLSHLTKVKVPRAYASVSLFDASKLEIHTFCDASVEAIAAVSYVKVTCEDGQVQVSFALGKAKLAPPHATTIPRLELCAAVLGVEVTEVVLEELALQPHPVKYYTDSKVTLGYIQNETRRFYVYVANRVQRIRRYSTPDQWKYVATDLNPADLATRSVKASLLKDSTWLNGPKFLQNRSPSETDLTTLELAAEDPELRPDITTSATHVKLVAHTNLGTTRFLRFSRWPNLVNAVSKIVLVAQKRHQRHHLTKEPISNDLQTEATSVITIIDARKRAQTLIVRNLQKESFSEEIDYLQKKKGLPKTSPLLKLSPIIDSEGLLRIGGRLGRADLPYEERHPLILPGKHHVTSLVVKNCHEEVKHQGRHFTHGMVRGRGLWVVGGKRLVNRVIHQCLNCRKLRGKFHHQKMADLPTERLTPSPPFTYVGLDVFGPWEVAARRTRGGHVNSKRWAVIFTCLSTRAIHIELIESMDASSFINALRRFMAIRGHVEQFHSDCGTNFVGAHNELEAALKEMDQETLETYLNSRGCKWVFNSPHASHTGGVWERMIGISRRILDSMFADLRPTRLTHEVLSTLMAEVTAIVNNRPLVAISSDPSAPEILTPSTLLTQKTLSLKRTPGNFVPQDLFTKQWRQVQFLANRFWSRWKKEFLPTLQSRRKWQTAQPNLKEGDLVLLRCKESPRNDWPLARISKAMSSADGRVRKVEVTTAKNGSKQSYTRPVTEVILLKTEHELNP